MRQIVLDTETTGLSPKQGHRITEIGCVEIIGRKITGNTYQTYLNPERPIDERAAEITGLTNEFLNDKPLFHEVVDEFIKFIQGAELIIHNAPFDLGFLDNELELQKHAWGVVSANNKVIDTLQMARDRHPGQKNNLDALCKRYKINNSHRKYHGALLDSEILAELYLAMTAGQTSLKLSADSLGGNNVCSAVKRAPQRLTYDSNNMRVIMAEADELAAHKQFLELMANNG